MYLLIHQHCLDMVVGLQIHALQALPSYYLPSAHALHYAAELASTLITQLQCSVKHPQVIKINQCFLTMLPLPSYF